MSDAWNPKRARLKRNAAVGANSVRVSTAWVPALPLLAKLGTELVTVDSIVGDEWSFTAPLAEPHHSGGYLVEITIRLLVGNTPVDYSAIAQNLKHKEASPEGEVEATWEIDTKDPASWIPDIEGHVVPFTLYSNESGTWDAFFGGYIGRIGNAQYPNGFHHLAFAGRGAYVTMSWDGYGDSHVWPAGTAGHVIVQDARDAFCSSYILSDNTHVTDGGQSIAQDLDGVMKSPRQLLDGVCQAGEEGERLDWYVRTNTDGGQRLWLTKISRQPTIKIPLSSIKAPVSLAHDVERQRTKVVVKWRDGYVSQSQLGAAVTRWRPFDYSTQIDNEPLARQVAKTHLAEFATLEAISDGQITVEWPKPIYAFDGVTELVHHRIRSGWLVEIVDFDAGGLTVAAMQIKSFEADHVQHQTSWALGDIEDDLNLAAQYVGKDSKRLGGPVSTLIPQNIAPPEGVPQGVGQQAIAASPSGRVGADKVAEDFGISTFWFPITELDDGSHSDDTPVTPTNILRAWTYYDRPIRPDARMLVRGLRLQATDGKQPPVDSGTLKVSVTRGGNVGNDYPALGDALGDITLSGGFEEIKNFPEAASDPDQHTANNVFLVEPGEYLLVTVAGSPAPDVFKGATLGFMVEKTEGSTKPETTGGPGISSVSASTGPDGTTWLVTTDRLAKIQIEYGETTEYGSRWGPTDQLKRVTTTTLPAVLLAGTHYRVIATDSSKHETTGSDHTI